MLVADRLLFNGTVTARLASRDRTELLSTQRAWGVRLRKNTLDPRLMIDTVKGPDVTRFIIDNLLAPGEG